MPFTPPASDTRISGPSGASEGFRPPVTDVQLSPAPAPAAPQPSMGKRFMDAATSRPTAEATGAVLGTAVGMPLGPVGMAGGAILGAMGGSAAYDAVGELIDFTKGKEPLGSNWQRLGQTVDNMLTAGAWEAGTMGLMRLAMPAGRAVGRLLTGVSANQAAPVASAQALGITPSASTIGSRARPFSAATERLPMAGVGKSATRVTRQVDELLESTANALGEPLSRDEAANLVALGGRQNALKLMNNYKAGYERVKAISAKLGDPKVFSAGQMSKSAQAFFGEVGQQAVGGATTGDLNALSRAASPENFLAGIAQLGDTPLSYPQIAALRRTASRLLGQTTPTTPGGPFRDPAGHQGLQGFLGATNEAIRNGRNLDLVQAWSEADDAFRMFKAFTNQPAFSEFRAAVPGISHRQVFNRPQSAEVQNLLDTLVKEKSPAVLRSLRTLVGDEAFSQVRRRALLGELNLAVQPIEGGGVRLHAPVIRHNLGLNGRNPEGLARLEALLEGGEVQLGQVRQLVDGLELVGDQFLPQVSQFMMRRLMLQTAGGGVKGGAHNIVGSLLLGGAGGSVATQGVGAAASGALYTLMGLRLINEALNSPRVLNSMLKSVELAKANRPFEAFIRRALIQMERDGEGNAPNQASPVPGATEQTEPQGPPTP